MNMISDRVVMHMGNGLVIEKWCMSRIDKWEGLMKIGRIDGYVRLMVMGRISG